tara:strand:+ start:2282 stop:3652 length:1371 start_codon:yes stop_codon:yes gene_type:complete
MSLIDNQKISQKILNNTKNEYLICYNSINLFRNKNLKEIKINSKRFFQKLIHLDLMVYNIKKIKYKNIFISHLINEKQLKTKEDLYLDNIINSVTKKEKGIRVFINHCNSKINYTQNYNLVNYIQRRSIYLLNDFFYIFYFIVCYMKIKIRISKIRNINLYNFFKNKLNLIDSIKSSSNLILAKNLSNFLSKKNNQNIFIPFEGHSWEKILIKKIRETNPLIKIFYYQFNLNDKNLLALKFLKNKKISPQILLFSSFVAKSHFQNSYKNNNLKTILIGSSRLININKINFDNKKCLVVPEGIEFEIELFLNLIKDYHKIFSNFEFILRLPPHIDYENKIDQHNLLNHSKISLSNNKNLLDDVKLCSFVLFRGSSAVFNCLYNGLIGIYYNYNNLNPNIPFPLMKILNKKLFIIKSVYELEDTFKFEIPQNMDRNFQADFKKYYFPNYHDKDLLKYL